MKQNKSFLSKHKKLSLLLLIGLLVGCILTTYSLITAPRDLGNKLEYLGSRSKGCGIACTRPSYFFGTDMKLSDIKNYFLDSKIQREELISQPVKPLYLAIDFSSELGSFYINYYEATPSEVASRWELNNSKMQSSKYPHTVEISKDSYKVIEKLLSK